MANHKRLNNIFDRIDADRSGEIRPDELIMHLLSTGTEHESISALFKAMDTDGNSSISREKFIAGFDDQMTAFQRQQPGAAPGEPEAEAAAAATFAAVDADKSGKLDLEELLNALAATGDDADRAEVEALFKRLDVNRDGAITMEEWRAGHSGGGLRARLDVAVKRRLKAKKLGGVDPRWDVNGFGAWLAGCPCVRVGFLRATKPVGRHQVTEHEWVTELPHGAGIDGVQLYAILSAAFGTQRSPDLAASELAALLQVLEGDQVHEDDLVWWDWLALSADDGDAGRAEAFRAFTTYKAQCVVLPTIAGHDSTSVFASSCAPLTAVCVGSDSSCYSACSFMVSSISDRKSVV